MTHLARSAVFCNGCGRRADLDPCRPLPETFAPIATSGTPLEGWARLDGNRHLCPECAAVYEARRREMESELAGLCAIDGSEFDL